MIGATHQNAGHPEWRVHAPTTEPSLVTAVSDVVEAGQRVITNRVELALLEVRAIVSGSIRTAALMVVAGLLFATAWLALNGGLALALATRLSPPLGLLAVAAVNGLLAIVFAASARRAGRRLQPASGDSPEDSHVT